LLSRFIAAGQRLQRGPDLQHFFFVLTSRRLGTDPRLAISIR